MDFSNDTFLSFLSSHIKEVEKIYKKSPMKLATMGASGLLRGKIKISDLRGADRKAVIKAKYRALLSERVLRVLRKNGVECGDDYVRIFGKKFFFIPSLLEEVTSGFLPVVVLDGYCAERFLKKDSIVIDAGANTGMFSVLAANLSPEGKIYSFEPAAITFGVLKKNAEQYPNITAYHNGLGDKSTTKKLFVRSWASGTKYIEDAQMSHNTGEYADREDIHMLTIDDFVKEHNLPRVDFIKMDTEGYEMNILKGATETIRKFSPVIAMSAYHHPSHKVELPKYVLSINPNYKYELHNEGDEDCIFWV